MALDDDEMDLFENLYWEKSLPIREKYDADLKKLDFLNQANKRPLYLETIKQFAREDINARVGAYIEANKRAGKCPSEDDFRRFADELKSMVPRFQYYFESRQTGIVSAFDKDLVGRILEVISLQVTELVGLALSPLRLFMAEHRVAANKDDDARRREQLSVWRRLALSVIVVIAGLGVLWSPIVRNWPWLQSHPNRLGLYCSVVVVVAGLCWAILDRRRRQLALVSMVVGGILVLIQIIGR